MREHFRGKTRVRVSCRTYPRYLPREVGPFRNYVEQGILSLGCTMSMSNINISTSVFDWDIQQGGDL